MIIISWAFEIFFTVAFNIASLLLVCICVRQCIVVCNVFFLKKFDIVSVLQELTTCTALIKGREKGQTRG